MARCSITNKPTYTMKHFFMLMSAFLLAGMLQSCCTSQKIYVTGEPGTEIYTPDRQHLVTIPANGKAKIKISSDVYYAFMLSRNAGTSDYIPFALDYRNHNYTSARVAEGVGVTLATAGSFAVLVGLIAALNGDEGTSDSFFVGGSALLGLGACIVVPANFRRLQTQYKYRYKYLTEQHTNQDLTFTHPQLTYATPELNAREEAYDTTKIAKPSVRGNTDRAARSVRGNAARVAGTYMGTGRLLQGTEMVEAYENMKIVVTRKDKNTVGVDVIDGQGESFFTSPGTYTVMPDKKGGFVLKHTKIPTALITIGKDNSVVYVHPRINMDNEIYKLEVKGAKK